MTNPTSIARALSEFTQKADKLILAAWLGGVRMQEGIQILKKANIPTFRTPEQAVRAFMTLVNYSRNLESLYETPRDIPLQFILDRGDFRSRFFDIIADKGAILSEATSKKLLDAYGIPVILTVPAATEDEAVLISEEMGFPVVLKISSPQITHKSDVGGIALNLDEAKMVRSAFKQIMAKTL